MNFRDAARNFGKRVALAFAFENEDAVVEFIRGYMVGRVEGLSAGQLAYAIENGSDLWSKIPEKWVAYGREIARDPKVREMVRKYAGVINSDLVLKWLQEDRPDFYSIIVNWPNPFARDWLRDQTDKVKDGILKQEPILLARALPSPQGAGPSQPQTRPGPPSSTEASRPGFRRFEADTP